MSKFCKVFETVKHGQVLVQLNKGVNEAPMISWSIDVGEFDINGIDVEYPNTSEGWTLASMILEDLNTEMAFRVAEQILKINEKEE